MNPKDSIVSYLVESKVDGCVLMSDVNRFWYTGFMSSAGYIIINKDGHSILLIDGRYFYLAKQKVHNIDEVVLLDGPVKQKLNSIFKQLNIETIALEGEYTTLQELKLFKSLDLKEIKDFNSAILRQTKQEFEIQKLQKAADIAALTIEWIKTQKLIGKSEKEVATMISIHMLEMGAEKNSFDPIVASGKNGSIPHHQNSDKLIEDGDMLTLDIGCIYEGYCSDITRSFIVGDFKKANPEILEIYEIVKNAQQLGIDKAKQGMTGHEIDQIVRGYIDNTKYKDYFTHSTGHGVGIEVHEYPYISKNYQDIVGNYSVFTIEPGIYVPDVGGVRIEDTVYFKNGELFVLTDKSNKNIKL